MKKIPIYTGSGLSLSKDNNSDKDSFLIETLDTSLLISEDENLLDALIESGHEIEYQCREGYCGACRTKVINGEVDYEKTVIAHLEDNEILPCCCRVKESLKLEISLRK